MPATIDQIAHQVLLHCPSAGKPLATLWAANAFARLAESRDRWSWRVKYGQIAIPAAYSTGTVSISSTDPTLVTGVATVWTPEMVGRQLVIGAAFGYDISEFIDSTHIRIALPWADVDQSAVGYMIVQRLITVPEDFAMFLSVLDPTRNKRLRTGVERRELDQRDPRRTSMGEPYVLAEAGYGPAYAGSVDATPFQVRGSGASPLFGGSYSGPSDTIYTVEITTGGASGTAVFKWRRGNGSYVTGVTTDEAGIGLTGGVTVYFPTGTYVLGDIFVARAVSKPGFGLARFEMWPTQTVQSAYPYYYLSLPPDAASIVATGYTLPRTIRPDAILKGALAEAAAWAGRSASEPNPLYDLKAATKNSIEFSSMIDLLALRDDDIYPADVTYYSELPFAGPPWDASYEQRHA